MIGGAPSYVEDCDGTVLMVRDLVELCSCGRTGRVLQVSDQEKKVQVRWNGSWDGWASHWVDGKNLRCLGRIVLC